MRKIAVIGSGYVGLVTGTCLAEFGMQVTCVDRNIDKIAALNQGKLPIYEPGLDQLVEKNNHYKRLEFTTDIKTAVEKSEVIFIAVGTPAKDDGGADVKSVLQVAEDIAKYINGYKVIVTKSTVPVGTGQKVKQIIRDILFSKNNHSNFDVVSNPEFLREGSAIQDFFKPDRIVLGVESKMAEKVMREVYSVPDGHGIPFIITNLETAEMIKYAANAFLAIKITYINEVANLCEKVGADVKIVAVGMGMDHRIGPKFLQPGPGYGGSCFPKDTKALAKTGRDNSVPLTLVEQTIIANEIQKHRMIEKINSIMDNLKGKTLGVLGITFKPETDDMREAPSLVILEGLVQKGAYIKVYDPAGEKEGKWRFNHIKDHLVFCHNAYDAIKEADAILILTDWPQFKQLNLNDIKNQMRGNYFFDFRNIFERHVIEAKGFQYYCVGR
ncbi:UDP-glucose dehydrogenase family protein [Geosporobacter ferrireducens]|uniref:UDP-glucose 6-dehydrogenase n=1 Tax=Geosporobacter ferrireducens TaxID=1424294 RepID=A0A1D8GKW6_9FIRM|nr:UDP-glucose/GDP-mannose dehydrogenase family protein [Geosporobacter ferrireducens]AOT71532.1 UDP-glucose 6-dehydrogenase [Geosporobacter ferrireducens]MTI57846.1 UDP-glucose/GDP-mannose dehydrogenase family protein [Geosporobacter ferrireducens]